MNAFLSFFSGSAESDDELLDGPPPPPLVSRPTAVAAAMRVLELQEQLDGSSHPSDGPPHSQGPPPPPLPGSANSGVVSPDSELADGEKALLRQMCNVSSLSIYLVYSLSVCLLVLLPPYDCLLF